jgi:hypothetical protein
VVGSDHPANADASAAPLTPPSTTLAISDTAATTSPSSSGIPAAHGRHDTSHTHATHASAPGTCPKCKMDLVKKGGAR